MRMSIGFTVLLLSPILLAGDRVDTSINALIRKLGSASFTERNAATLALQELPDSAPALRKVLSSPDSEMRRRAAEILEHFERCPLRELEAAAKAGHIDRAIELVGSWPSGKYEEESWRVFRDVARVLAERHEMQGGEKLKRFPAMGENAPIILSAKRITVNTKANVDRLYMLRAGAIEFDYRQRIPGELKNPFFLGNLLVVANESVRMLHGGDWGRQAIYCGGPIELEGQVGYAIIVSGADITLNCDLGGSLVIARGKITCTGTLDGNTIISGKSVSYKRAPRNCRITENEPNPLGFICWSHLPKDKAATKTK